MRSPTALLRNRMVSPWTGLFLAPIVAAGQTLPSPQGPTKNAPYAAISGAGNAAAPIPFGRADGPEAFGDFGGPIAPSSAFAGAGPTAETGYSPALGGGLASEGGAINMIGDQSPLRMRPGRPGSAAIASSVSAIKVCESQSPRPQDRIYYLFNYYDDLGAATNRGLGVPLTDIRAYRHIFGAEKTFNQGKGSVGFRLPLNTATATPRPGPNPPIPGGTSTALGDLNLYAKYILEQHEPSGSLVSAGLIVTPPTGTARFANAPFFSGDVHTTVFQPFLGYLWNRGDFFFQGFFSGAFPADDRDVTILYNDLGIGYYIYRAPDADRFLTALVPMFEVHINTPLTHREFDRVNNSSGAFDAVNLTYGLSALFGGNTLLTCALVTPVTGPRPFDLEAVAQLNIFFGGRRTPPIPTLPPPFIGG